MTSDETKTLIALVNEMGKTVARVECLVRANRADLLVALDRVKQLVAFHEDKQKRKMAKREKKRGRRC